MPYGHEDKRSFATKKIKWIHWKSILKYNLKVSLKSSVLNRAFEIDNLNNKFWDSMLTFEENIGIFYDKTMDDKLMSIICSFCR